MLRTGVTENGASGGVRLHAALSEVGAGGNVTVEAGDGGRTGGSVTMESGSENGVLSIRSAGSMDNDLSGDIEIASGEALSSGDLRLETGTALDSSGAVVIASGDSEDHSGQVALTSGGVSGGGDDDDDAQSGGMRLTTGNATKGTAGSIVMTPGTSSTAANAPLDESGGHIVLRAGAASGSSTAVAGGIRMSSGQSKFGTSGQVSISTSANAKSSGTLHVFTGSVEGTSGSVNVTSGMSATGSSGNVSVSAGKGAIAGAPRFASNRSCDVVFGSSAATTPA